MISLPIFTYPVFAALTGWPSKLVNIPILSTVNWVVVSSILSDNKTGEISLLKSTTLTLFCAECIPWFLWLNFITNPFLIGSVGADVGAEIGLYAPLDG